MGEIHSIRVQIDISEQNNVIEENEDMATMLRQTGEKFGKHLEKTAEGPATSDEEGDVGAPIVELEF